MRIRNYFMMLAVGCFWFGLIGCAGTAKKGVSALTAPFKMVAKPVKSVSGKVANGVKGVKNVVSEPFKGDGGKQAACSSRRSFDARISTDEYEAVPNVGNATYSGQEAELKSEWKSSAFKRSRRMDEDSKPLLGRAEHEFDDAFQAELRQLKEMESLTSKRASQYESDAREKMELAENYRKKLEEARKRKARLQRIMDAYRRNPDAFAGEDYENLSFQQVPPKGKGRAAGQLMSGDISSCSAPGGWRADDRAGKSGTEDYVPPIDDVNARSSISAANAGDTLSAPPMDGEDVAVGAASPAGDNPSAATAPVKPRFASKPSSLNPMILATDGTGADAIVIVGAGSRNGVKKGMLFKLVDEKGHKVVLVVKDVYLTYSRCYPHPAYANGNIRVAARAMQISGLNE